MDQRSKLAQRLLPGGEEPDPRFTLANERTFLAWIRTSLAFIAAGVALEAFAPDLFSNEVRKLLAGTVIGFGLLVAASATWHWLAVERAMRMKKPLPLPVMAPILAIAAVVTSGAIIVLLYVS